jgi:hypothetical protein
MERIEAEAVVATHIVMVEQYQAVPRSVAEELLGVERYGRLLRDKVRNLGPTADTVYPWNVVDYIHVPDLGSKGINTSAR